MFPLARCGVLFCRCLELSPTSVTRQETTFTVIKDFHCAKKEDLDSLHIRALHGDSNATTLQNWHAQHESMHCRRRAVLHFESKSKLEFNIRLKIVHTVLSCNISRRFNTAASHPQHLFPLRLTPDLANGRFLTGNVYRPVWVVHERNRFTSPNITKLTIHPPDDSGSNLLWNLDRLLPD
jgi:hypothetical protein